MNLLHNRAAAGQAATAEVSRAAAPDRLERLRQAVDEILPRQPDPDQRRCGYVHLYGVSAACVLLALRRGLEVELCAAAGMLHDIWSYQVGPNPEHASLGLPEAERILTMAGFSPAEVETICAAIRRHSDKASVHGELDELLKDADVLQHYLYNPALQPPWRQYPRLAHVFDELGLK